jgi:outer membrane receptor protein involved in Fe transport
LDLAYMLGAARVRYGIDVLAGMSADLTGAVTVPTRVLHSVGARVDVPGVTGLRVGFEVRNLLDVRTAEYQGAAGPVLYPIGDLYEYPLPGRSFLATVRYLVH